MQNSIPKTAPLLMHFVYRKVFPQVSREINYWKEKANAIPNDELRAQAIASIQTKKFHCQGGGVYSILAGSHWQEAIRFIVAYQTISDYLDNLCDRSTSLDPDDFRLLHQSMMDALTPGGELTNYYALRTDQDDGGYLNALVITCQDCLDKLEQYDIVKKYTIQLEQLYSDLQVHKHVKKEERIPRLENWYNRFKQQWPTLSWYEFSASSGSTLGIFCLVSYTMGQTMDQRLAKNIFESYFPFMQGLHILLDYYIDQLEDTLEGDLNFCDYYMDTSHLKERLRYFIKQANEHVQLLPHRHFHEMIYNGLVGLYLADPKVKKLESGKEVTKSLIQESGRRSAFFHLNVKVYNKITGKR